MKLTVNKLLLVLLVIGTALILGISTVVAEDQAAKVLILPFSIHAEKDLAYLQEGIEDMLSTRLAIEGKTVLMDPDLAEESLGGLDDLDQLTVLALGQSLGADFVAYGSLTVIFENISTDAHFVDIGQQKTIVTFNRTGKNLGDIIAHLDQFSAEIGYKAFEQKAPAFVPPPPSTTPAPAPAPAVPQTTESYRQHPDKMMQQAPGSGNIVFPNEQAGVGTDDNLWRSKRFKQWLVNLTIDDVDNDGNNETIVITYRSIMIFRFAEGRFRKLAEIKGGAGARYIHVDAIDANGNGTAEIFVTNVPGQSGTGALASFVLEWDGYEFKRIAENIRWYFTVVKNSNGEKTLYGQKRTTEELFSRGIYKMIWINGEYTATERLPLPFNTSIFAFTAGDVLNNQTDVFAVNRDGKFPSVVDINGKTLWKSGDDYGGTGTFFEYIPSYNMGDRDEKQNTLNFYMPLPLQVVDLNRDGLNEVITILNEPLLWNVMQRVRSYKKGMVTSLIWDGSGLYQQWRTREFQKYISDFVVGDLNNDGRDEIAFLVVENEGTSLTKPKSYISTIDVQREIAAKAK